MSVILHNPAGGEMQNVKATTATNQYLQQLTHLCHHHLLSHHHHHPHHHSCFPRLSATTNNTEHSEPLTPVNATPVLVNPVCKHREAHTPANATHVLVNLVSKHSEPHTSVHATLVLVNIVSKQRTAPQICSKLKNTTQVLFRQQCQVYLKHEKKKEKGMVKE